MSAWILLSVIMFLLFVAAVAALRRHTRSLQTLLRRDESLLEAATEGMIAVDDERRITFVNRAACRMLGCEAKDLKGRQEHLATHHSKTDGTPLAWEECPVFLTLGNGTTRHCTEDVLWRQDGTAYRVESTTAPIKLRGRSQGRSWCLKRRLSRCSRKTRWSRLSMRKAASPNISSRCAPPARPKISPSRGCP